jgi:hypothetical protein
MISRIALAVAMLGVTPAVDTPPPSRRNFVSCPIVQDTRTVPCWLSEHEGQLYYLGIQTDISSEFHPPYLGHKVLVEGTVSDEPRICGGIVLKPVRVSPLPELDASCSQILTAVDQFTVPFAPRPPGPSGGRLAFQAPPAPPVQVKPPFEAKEFTLSYDFDMPVMGRHATVLSQILDYATRVAATRVRISARRGATLLSSGAVLTEGPAIADARAREIVDLLKRAGLTTPAFEIKASSAAEVADGIDDWRSRSATVRVEP